MTHPEAWRGILDEDEVIVWQGQPEPGVKNEWKSAFQPLFFTFYTGFSLFWMVMASKAGGVFWMFGLIFFLVGAYGLVGVHFYKAYQRRHMHYTLTSKRAFIAGSAFGQRTLDSYPITPDMRLELTEHKALTSIFFAQTERRFNHNARPAKIGFELLKEGRDVYQKMRKIQQSI